MNLIKIVLLSLTLLSLPISANSDTAPEPVNTELKARQDSCGMSDTGLVKPFDLSICKDDIVFNILYNSFPSLFEYYVFEYYKYDFLLDISKIDYQNLTQQEITNKEADLIVKVNQSRIYESAILILFELAFATVLFLLTAKLIVSVFNAQQNGEALKQEYSFDKTVKWWLLGALMLAPIGNVFFINILSLIFILFTVVSANVIYGYFLYTLSTGFAINPVNNVEDLIPSEAEHSYYFANKSYENLVNAELCKIRSTNMLLSSNIDLTFSDVDKYLKCQLPENTPVFDFVRTNTANVFNAEKNEFEKINRSINGFLNYDIETSQENQVDKTGFFNKLTFRANSQSCNIERSTFKMEPFECLELKAPYPINNENLILKDLVKDEYYEALKEAIAAINNTVPDAEQILIIFNRLKETIYRKSIEKEQELVNRSYDEITSIEENLLLNKLRSINAGLGESEIQEIAILFHQALINHIEIGTVIFEKKLTLNDGFERVVIFENMNVINETVAMAKIAAKLIMDRKCYLDQEAVTKTTNFINQDKNSEKSLECFDPFTQKEYGYIDYKPMSKERFIEAIQNGVWNVEQELIDNKNRFITLLSYKRRVIDNSLHKALIVMNAETVREKKLLSLRQARQKGFLSFPSIIMNADKYQFDTTNYIRQIANSIHSLNLFNDFNKVDFFVDDDFRESPFYEDFKKFDIATINHLTQYKNDFPYNKYVNNYNHSLNEEEEEAKNNNVMSFINNNNAIAVILRSVGATDDTLTNDNINYECAKDITKCPVPAKSPLLGLNEGGKTLINQSIVGFGTALTLSGAQMLITKSAANSIDRENKDAKKDMDVKKKDDTKKEKKVRNKKTKSKFTGKGFDFFSSAISLLVTLLILFSSYLLILGALMAFAIPLAIFIFMMLNFTSWLVMAISFLFFGVLSIMSLCLMEDNRQAIKQYYRNILLSLLFKPPLIIISMIFVWYFTTAIFFLINLSVGELFESINLVDLGNFIFSMGFVEKMIYAVIFMFMIFQIVRHLLKLIADITDQFFAMLNLNYRNDDDNSLTDNFIGAQLLEGTVNTVREKATNITDTVKTKYKDKFELRKAERNYIAMVDKGEDFNYNGFTVNAKELSAVKKGKTYQFDNSYDLVRRVLRE